MKEGKTSGVKTFSELARLLASAYVCPHGHRERAHPAPSVAINCYFQHCQEVNVFVVQRKIVD